MRIPINWLKEYISIKDSPKVLAEKLIMSGTEIEAVDLGASNFQGVVVGEILEIKKHPNADKLQIAYVNVGKEKLKIVCGAPNIKVGQKVPVAIVGTKLGEFEIKKTEIRGIKSHGMMCSEEELGISDDNTGIMILDPRAKIGSNLGEALGSDEIVLEAEITPNRGDCLSIIGIAREVAAITRSKLKIQKSKLKEIGKKPSDYIDVEVKDKDLCPRYIARVVEGVKIGPSPKWMQDRLSAVGIRPINNIVDVTNYVMFEWGQPLHAFDFEKISGVSNSKLKNKNSKSKKKKIIIRTAKKGEKIVTLDEEERELDEDMLIITDSKGPIAIAGVMGGANSEVDEKTKTVVLESATFNPISVRRTASRLNLRSEASSRFEKDIPMPLNEIAILRAAGLLSQIAEGKVLSGKVDVISDWIWICHIGLKISRLEEFLGEGISADKSINILKSLGFKAEKFDIAQEVKKHIGKPYKYGANFKKDGTFAFDCSYLTDYIYSLIGQNIGHTALKQFEKGKPSSESDLQPGDLLFSIGHNPRKSKKYPCGVGHVGIYIGGGKVVDAQRDSGKVTERSLRKITKAKDYLGARRYVDDLSDWIAVTVPWWRLDVSIEEDLIEEIARIYGYNNIPSSLPSGKLPEFSENKNLLWEEKAKEILSGAGFSEVLNYSFLSGEILKKVKIDPKACLKIANPLTSEQEYMRISLIPSLLLNVSKNEGNFQSLCLFELANVYQKKAKGEEELPKEIKFLAGAVTNPKGSDIKYKDGREFYSAKGAVELLFKKLGVEGISYKELGVPEKYGASSNQLWHSGRSADILVENKKIGEIGEIHPQVKKEFNIKQKVALFNLNFEKLCRLATIERNYVPASKFPAVILDLSLIVPFHTLEKDIRHTIRKEGENLIKNIQLFDMYTGRQIEKGKKSLAFRISYQSDKKTLTDLDVEKIQNKIIKSLEEKFNAQVRTKK